MEHCESDVWMAGEMHQYDDREAKAINGVFVNTPKWVIQQAELQGTDVRLLGSDHRGGLFDNILSLVDKATKSGRSLPTVRRFQHLAEAFGLQIGL